ncbi:MAG: NADH-quinone oxidoreductase subunit N [Bacteroidales bacterium]|nr:NADH-quinone oxidoreductase subunit N [Bacteroidales bacterium]
MDISDLIKSISLFKPETTLIVTFMLAMILDMAFKKSKNIAGYIAIAGLVIAGIFLFQQTGVNYKAFANLLVIDSFGQFMKFIVLMSSLIIIVFSFFSNELHNAHTKLGEYYTLIIGMTFGMFLLVGSANLIMIYVAIETMSISSYVLAGYTREVKRASEASLKYVIFGAVSSGIMIYGISILFGLTGSLNLFEINQFLSVNNVATLPLLLSGLMILSGFGYKISAVPFHFWTPDVYEGAPVTITAYLSVASKAAGFAVLLRFFKTGLLDSVPGTSEAWQLLGNIDWHYVIAVLAVLTMTLGNLVAVWQTNMKRLLAYSSIAHAGYLLMAVSVMNDNGVSAVLIYFVFYMLMNLGAFFVVQLIANKLDSENIDEYNGLGYRSPVLAVCMTVFLISLAGLPPTSGFIGKLYVFSSVINSGYIWLAIIGVLNSVVSLYYYAKIIRNMYLRDVESAKTKLVFSPVTIAIVLMLAIPSLLFGVYFTPIVEWANYSMNIFVGN